MCVLVAYIFELVYRIYVRPLRDPSSSMLACALTHTHTHTDPLIVLSYVNTFDNGSSIWDTHVYSFYCFFFIIFPLFCALLCFSIFSFRVRFSFISISLTLHMCSKVVSKRNRWWLMHVPDGINCLTIFYVYYFWREKSKKGQSQNYRENCKKATRRAEQHIHTHTIFTVVNGHVK